MVAGAYRGGLCWELMQKACKNNLFSNTAANEISSWNELSTIHITHFLNNPDEEGPFNVSAFSDEDRQIIRELCLAITERAALLVAINISAAIIKGDGGKHAPCCVNVDGSTFYKLKGFKESVETHLHGLLDKRDIQFELVHIDNAPVIGAAVAGLAKQ
jgi:hexokinase